MTKLCPRGKAAAKRKFKVYPSAYANAYASRICAGKIKDPSGVKRKDFKGPKRAMGGMIKRATYMGGGLTEATQRLRRQGLKEGGGVDTGKKGEGRSRLLTAFMRSSPRTRGLKGGKPAGEKRDIRKVEQMIGKSQSSKREQGRKKAMGGGMMRPM